MHLCYFSWVLFGCKEIFCIFANDKGISISTIPPSSKNYLWSVFCNALNHNGLWYVVRKRLSCGIIEIGILSGLRI